MNFSVGLELLLRKQTLPLSHAIFSVNMLFIAVMFIQSFDLEQLLHSTNAASDSVCSPRVYAKLGAVTRSAFDVADSCRLCKHFAGLDRIYIPSNGLPRRWLVLLTGHTISYLPSQNTLSLR